MCQNRGPTHCCLSITARFLACVTRCLVFTQETLNTIWYHFALYTATKAGMWPNYTSGKLYEIPEMAYNVRRGRVEEIQVYQFDHTGQGPQESVV